LTAATHLIKDVEDVVGEFSWVAKGKELLVDTTELVLIELTGWAVL
jgi:hypothetical protein